MVTRHLSLPAPSCRCTAQHAVAAAAARRWAKASVAGAPATHTWLAGSRSSCLLPTPCPWNPAGSCCLYCNHKARHSIPCPTGRSASPVPQAQEGYDQPDEARNEVGEPMEPFHLKRELEVRCSTAAATQHALASGVVSSGQLPGGVRGGSQASMAHGAGQLCQAVAGQGSCVKLCQGRPTVLGRCARVSERGSGQGALGRGACSCTRAQTLSPNSSLPCPCRRAALTLLATTWSMSGRTRRMHGSTA